MEGRYAGINIIQPRLVQCQEMLIMGIETRSSHRQEAHPLPAAISQLWNRFLTEQLWLTIPDIVNPQVLYGVYTDYDTNTNTNTNTSTDINTIGECTLIVATEVSNIDNPPEQMVGIAIPPARYLVFSGTGTPLAGTHPTWQQIRDYFAPADVPYQRAYTTDFECYKSGQISIYVAVK